MVKINFFMPKSIGKRKQKKLSTRLEIDLESIVVVVFSYIFCISFKSVQIDLLRYLLHYPYTLIFCILNCAILIMLNSNLDWLYVFFV